MQKENKYGKYQCPCCGYYTLTEEYLGCEHRFETCDVCYWEDDGLQFDDPSYSGGANYPSLNEARENFKKFGASDLCLLDLTREPKQNELGPEHI